MSSWRGPWGSTGSASIRRSKTRDTYYWADRLGLLVWEEMPSAYRFTWQSVERLTHEWLQVIARDVSHPCIIAWVPFNESWGAPNLPDNPAERHYVRSVYHLTKTLDPTRPVIGNDGWESVATDIIGIHDYDSDPARIGRRYRADELRPRLFRRERPGGRLLVLEGQPHVDHPIVLSEFGGITLRHRTWQMGLFQVQRPRSSRSDTPRCCGRFARSICSPASATRSLPTPTRKRTGCCMPTGGRSFPSTLIAAATSGSPRPADAGSAGAARLGSVT